MAAACCGLLAVLLALVVWAGVAPGLPGPVLLLAGDLTHVDRYSRTCVGFSNVLPPVTRIVTNPQTLVLKKNTARKPGEPPRHTVDV